MNRCGKTQLPCDKCIGLKEFSSKICDSCGPPAWQAFKPLPKQYCHCESCSEPSEVDKLRAEVAELKKELAAADKIIERMEKIERSSEG